MLKNLSSKDVAWVLGQIVLLLEGVAKKMFLPDIMTGKQSCDCSTK